MSQAPSPGQRIATLMQDAVITVDIDDTVEQVERILAEHHFSFVLVVDARRFCCGIIRRRDIRRFHARGKNPRACHAWEICTPRLIDVSPDTSIAEAAGLMARKHIPHIVVTEHGILQGLVTANDFVIPRPLS